MELSSLAGIGGIEVNRDGSFQSIGSLDHRTPGQLVSLEGRETISQALSNPFTTCIITTKELVSEIPADHAVGIALSENPSISLVHIHNHLAEKTGFYGTWGMTTRTGNNTWIHPSAVISETDVSIGNNCSIGPNVMVYGGSEIDDNVTLGPGTIIGSDRTSRILIGIKPVTVVRTGRVRIHKDANIHANCCIAGPVFGGYTEIGASVQIDNLVRIGQGTSVGIRSMIVALAVIGECVTIGNDVWIGPGAAISDNLVIGDKAYVTLGSVVMENVSPGLQVTGNYAIEHKKFLAFLKTIR